MLTKGKKAYEPLEIGIDITFLKTRSLNDITIKMADVLPLKFECSSLRIFSRQVSNKPF